MNIAILTNDNFFSFTVLKDFLEKRKNNIILIVFSSALIGKRGTFASIKWSLQNTGFSKNICKIDLPSGQSIIEVPMSTVTILGKALPAAGGGYIRHFPYAVTKWAIKRIQKQRPVIVYMHPYEIDTEPKIFEVNHLSYKQKCKVFKFHKVQQRNRNTVAKKLFKLLNEFKFTTIGDVISQAITD